MGRIADDLRKEMQEALYKSYLKIYESGECETQYQAIDRARKSRAPHFFTTAKNCCYVLKLMEDGMDTGLRNPDKIRKFEELKRLADEWKQKDEYPGLLSVCREIVEQPAPEYYICYSTAKQMIQVERRKRQKEAMRWVKR